MKAILSRLAALAPTTALLISTLPAQFVWPASYATVPGNAVMNAPFSYRPVPVAPGQAALGTRCMVIIDQASLPFPVGTVLTQITLRRDVSYPNTGYAGNTGKLGVRIGRAAFVPDQVQDVRFARLWDGAWTEAAAITSFQLPATAAPGTSLPIFNIVIPFTNNYTYQGGPLAIDIVFTPSGTTPTPFRIDAFAQPRPQNGTSRRAGEGCVGSNGFTPIHYALPETTMPGRTMVVQLEGGRLPPSPGSFEILAFHLVGLQNVSYQSNPLPVALSSLGGQPGCFLRVDPLLSYTVLVGNNSRLFSRATNSVPLPANSALVGAVLYSQWLLPDTGYNVALPIIASDAQAITLGEIPPTPTPRMATTIWKYGAAGFDNESGRMVPDGYGPVIQFN